MDYFFQKKVGIKFGMKGFRAVPLQPQTAEGAFFRALPEKNPRGICTDAPFLLTLQSLPFFSGAGLAH